MLSEQDLQREWDNDIIHIMKNDMFTNVNNFGKGKLTTAINFRESNACLENPKTNGDILKEIFNEHNYNILKDRMVGTLWWNTPYMKP